MGWPPLYSDCLVKSGLHQQLGSDVKFLGLGFTIAIEVLLVVQIAKLAGSVLLCIVISSTVLLCLCADVMGMQLKIAKKTPFGGRRMLYWILEYKFVKYLYQGSPPMHLKHFNPVFGYGACCSRAAL